MWAKRRDAKKKAWIEKTKKREMQMDHLKEFIGRGGTYANVSGAKAPYTNLCTHFMVAQLVEMDILCVCLQSNAR